MRVLVKRDEHIFSDERPAWWWNKEHTCDKCKSVILIERHDPVRHHVNYGLDWIAYDCPNCRNRNYPEKKHLKIHHDTLERIEEEPTQKPKPWWARPLW